ncbi:hypothetical protein F8388_005124 [Cannabis sativa]|uniref:SPT2 chromatin protein n=1 Tax=Cannabis sativa TaxID=3483 RepID=A0A7J6DUY0_CANSA|nr:hypothetical protein F8388_005124 [Cannabis sativa]
MEDEYEDYDDSGYGYEEEGDEEEGEEEEYEEEDPNLSKERLEYLAYRQRVKERIRKQRKKEGGSGPNNSYGDRKKLPYDNYGSFFGPSQPVIASRVIQESKSLLENQHLTPQLSNALHPDCQNDIAMLDTVPVPCTGFKHVHRKKSPSSSSALAKPGVHSLKPKVVNEVKTKVQKLKDTRDYSFLMDDDAEIPAPAKVPPQRNVSAPNSGVFFADVEDARSAQLPMKSKQALGNNASHSQGSHTERKSALMNGHSSKLPLASRPSSAAMDSRRQHSSSNGSGSGRHSISNGTGPGRPSSSNGTGSGRPSSGNGTGPGRPSSGNGTGPGRPSSGNGTGPGRPSSSNGTGRPIVTKNLPLRSPAPVVRKVATPAAKSSIPSSKSSIPSTKSSIPRTNSSSMPSMQKPFSSKLQPSISRQQQQLGQRRELQAPAKAKLSSKQSTGLSRPQINKPQRQSSSHLTSHDNRPKKKPMRRYSDDEGDEGDQAISMIRQMFGYNPKKFAGRDDDDDSDMEANFDDIQREEKRSEIIARREDEEEQRLIEEEERREREAKMRRLKKRKLGH